MGYLYDRLSKPLFPFLRPLRALRCFDKLSTAQFSVAPQGSGSGQVRGEAEPLCPCGTSRQRLVGKLLPNKHRICIHKIDLNVK